MTFYVAKIEVHDEGCKALLFDASHMLEAEMMGATLASDFEGECVEVTPLENFMDGYVMELCTI